MGQHVRTVVVELLLDLSPRAHAEGASAQIIEGA